MGKRGIIIASGECNIEQISPDKEDVIIAADGGICHCKRLGLKPDWILGDFDSLADMSLLQDYSEDKVIKLPCEKDDTDTLAALKFGLEKGIKEFEIYGALGGRLSHTMANTQCLLYLKRNGANGKILDKDIEMFLIKDESCEIGKDVIGILSVFAMDGEAKGVTISGCKYEIEDATLTSDYPLGVSNELMGTEAHIRVREGSLLIVIEKNKFL